MAGISVIQTENGRFDEADYYRRALAALHEPLIQRKIAAHDFVTDPLLKPPPRLASVADLRRMLERALVWRGPLAFWLDNAHALASGWVEQRLEWLRSLADATNTPHVLAGTYDLLHLWNLNGQLGRRSHDIHFGRYHLDQSVDQEDFLRVLVSFEHSCRKGGISWTGGSCCTSARSAAWASSRIGSRSPIEPPSRLPPRVCPSTTWSARPRPQTKPGGNWKKRAWVNGA
ncbi:MAG: ATP-binding protein [Chloroflexi bacterium]|nr:ATP-binding protein [Chloroflexota bacterium]